jgi:iron complex outermembrane recepter protein
MGLGWRVNSVGLLRIAALATVSAMVLLPKMSVAQSASSGGPSAAQDLPAVTINPAPVRSRAKPQAEHRTRAPTQVAARPAASPPAPRTVPVVENPRGPINGYVAKRSSSGTKTNTPINETPQAISVVGAEQIRDQKPAMFDEILRYSPGVVAGTFGADTRNDWFLIRGFKSDDNSLFLDGLQLFYTSYASWKLQPFNLERVEVLRGPSAVLYGGSSPSGIVNAVSKTPPTEPIRYLEAGVNNFGNAYVSFDLGGPVQTSKDNGQLFYRLVGQVQNGGTQVDFTPNNNYFIAPSLTYRPDADTSFTVLASASKLDTRGIAFLPYVGTVTNASFGRIPTSLFPGDPSIDTFQREQEMLGYQFEKNLSDNVTFRQNARFAHVDVTYRGYVGNDYANQATANLGRYNWYAKDTANQADMDNQVEYRFGTGPVQHTMLFGLDLKSYRIDDYQNFEFGTVPPINIFNPVYGIKVPFSATASAAPFRNYLITQQQLGTYVQDQMKLGRFTLVLSGRNDWVSTDQANRATANTMTTRDDSKFSGRAGLIYNFDNGIAPYVAYATSYNPAIGLNAAGELFKPETGKQAEVGVKYQPTWLDGHFGATWFDLRRQNVATSNASFAILQDQIGEVHSQGVELEAVANITPGLKLTASYTRYSLIDTSDANAAYIGKVPTNTPREIASAWADYTFKSGPLTGFGFGGGIRHVGSSFADQLNTLMVPSYTLGDAAVHYEWDNWRLALNVANIADKTYVASCSTASACFYGDRRRITGSIAYKW